MAIDVRFTATGPERGPVVVLAGSLGSTGAMWEPQVAPLAGAGYRVVRYDHRGHGGSAVPDGPSTIGDLGGDALALLDRLGVRTAHFAGLSLGGMVGMWLAAHAPDRIAGLALLCTSARLGPAEGWTARAASVRAQGTAAVADAVVGRWFTGGYAAEHPGTVADMRAMVAATPAEGYASCCEAIGSMDLRTDLPSLTAPTLTVAGAEDPSTPPPHLESIARLVPGSSSHVLDGGAHLASWECADQVNPLLLDHFAAAPPASSTDR